MLCKTPFVYCLSVCLSVCLSAYPYLLTYKLLQNHGFTFNHTWHKAFLGEDDSSLLKWYAIHLSKRDNSYIMKIHWILLQNHRANFYQTWHRTSVFKGDSVSFKWRTLPFYSIKLKIYKLLKFFSRTAGLLSSKHDTKYSWIKGICSI